MEKVGFGVIGTGIFGENHAVVYSRLPGAELVAVCDVNAERARAVGEKYGARAVYTDYRELLRNPDVQAVSVATPDFAHRDIAVAAAQAGKHILCEKPLATSVKEAQDIVNAAKKAGVKLMVDYHNRINPPLAAAKQSVEAGEIGQPVYAYIRLSNMKYVPTTFLSWGSKSSALWFLGSHTIDLMRYLLTDEVQRVHAVSRSGILKKLGVDTQDFHVAIAEFKKGAVVTFENVWILPDSHPMLWDFRMELVGSEGAIYVNTSHHGAFEKHTGGRMSYSDVFGTTPTSKYRIGGFVLEAIGRFVDALLHDEPVLATGEDGLAAVRVADAIVRSADTGKPVDL